MTNSNIYPGSGTRSCFPDRTKAKKQFNINPRMDNYPFVEHNKIMNKANYILPLLSQRWDLKFR